MREKPRFKNAENQSEFLGCVVRMTFSGKLTTEDAIGKKLFGSKYTTDQSTDVRVTAGNLRNTLIKYYENEGLNDLVIIALPKPPSDRSLKLPRGDAYKPFFRYNPNHEIAREYVSGVFHLRPAAHFKLQVAAEHFDNVLHLQPNHVDALIGMAETSLLYAFAYPSRHEDSLMKSAVHCGNRAVKINSQYWHAHAVLGAAHYFSFRYSAARASFEEALRLDKAKTLRYGWYHAFLLADRKIEDALSLAKKRSESDPTDTFPKALYGLYLYLNRDLDAAKKVLTGSLLIDQNCWASRLGLTLVELALGNTKEALLHHNLLEATVLNHPADLLFPGLSACLFVAANLPDLEELKQKVGTVIFEKDEHIPWSQAGIAALAFDDLEGSVRSFSKAWTYHEPIFAFLDLLPLLDPWRQLGEEGGCPFWEYFGGILNSQTLEV